MLFEPFLYLLGLVGRVTIEDERILLRRFEDDSLEENNEGIARERPLIGHEFHHSVLADGRCRIDTESCSRGCYDGSLSLDSPSPSPMLRALESRLVSIEDFPLLRYCLRFDSRPFYFPPFFHLLKLLLICSEYGFLIGETEILEDFSHLPLLEGFEEYLFDELGDYGSRPKREFELKLFDVTGLQQEELP